jgi:hypothetical protein
MKENFFWKISLSPYFGRKLIYQTDLKVYSSSLYQRRKKDACMIASQLEHRNFKCWNFNKHMFSFVNILMMWSQAGAKTKDQEGSLKADMREVIIQHHDKKKL